MPGIIEATYDSEMLRTATRARRMYAYLIDNLVALLVVGCIAPIEWVIGVPPGVIAIPLWVALMSATMRHGQTPGKRLLGLYVLRDDGYRAGGTYTVLREIGIKAIVFGGLGSLTFGIAFVAGGAFCLWDNPERRTLWDRLAGSRVAWSPNGYRPPTRSEQSGGQTRREKPGGMRISASATRAQRLREAHQRHDAGLISDGEYASLQHDILADL